MNEGEFVDVQSQGNLCNRTLHVRYKDTHSKRRKQFISTLITFLQWIVLVKKLQKKDY